MFVQKTIVDLMLIFAYIRRLWLNVECAMYELYTCGTLLSQLAVTLTGLFIVHVLYVLLFCTAFVQNTFQSNNYLTDYAQDMGRNACRYLYKISIIFVLFYTKLAIY
jgi:hypothetical protein